MVRWTVVLLGLVVMALGCSSSVKPDPWAEYLIAQEVWENEFEQRNRLVDLAATEPTDENKAALQRANENFETAIEHLKDTRARLPKKR